jgi:hypothetical protein
MGSLEKIVEQLTSKTSLKYWTVGENRRGDFGAWVASCYSEVDRTVVS